MMPILEWYFYGRDRPGALGSIILSSISAIITCLPIQLYYFGSLNLIAILANLLILPTIPLVMGASFLTGLLGIMRLDFLAQFAGWVSEVVLKFHIKIINELADKTEFMFEFKKNNLIFLGLYAIILVFIGIAMKKQAKISENNINGDNDGLKLGDKMNDLVRKRVGR